MMEVIAKKTNPGKSKLLKKEEAGEGKKTIGASQVFTKKK